MARWSGGIGIFYQHAVPNGTNAARDVRGFIAVGFSQRVVVWQSRGL
ncbi:MAG: hypothetical protein LBU92_03660 [Prevotellaceae bacterium]|nr:hypothetical protein [Prevotellaceae bacterium]